MTDGGRVSTRMSTHTDGPEFPASSSSQISNAFSPSFNWQSLDQVPPGSAAISEPSTNTPVPVSRVPSRVTERLFEMF